MSFGLVSMLGLLPVGYRIIGDSVKQTRHLQIAQAMGAFAQQADYSSLASDLSGSIRKFDGDGVQTTESTAAVFQADFSPPGQSGEVSPVANSKLRVVTFWIDDLSQRDAAGTPKREYHSVYVVDTGR